MVNASAFILMLRSLIKVYTTSNTKKPHKLVYLDDLKENLRKSQMGVHERKATTWLVTLKQIL